MDKKVKLIIRIVLGSIGLLCFIPGLILLILGAPICAIPFMLIFAVMFITIAIFNIATKDKKVENGNS